jgi:small subunit ribosomal protein S5
MMNNNSNSTGRGGFRKDRRQEEKSEFDQFILDLARVTRVTQGGKHMSFRTCVILGDRKGRVAFGVAKGKDVQGGVEKAVRQAKKNMIRVPLVRETIPHAVLYKYKAAAVLLRPAPKGSGIIAGGAARVVFEMAGIPNVSCKILGTTKNKIAIVKATFEALKSFKRHSAPVKKFEMAKKEEVAVEAKAEEKKPAKKAASKKA